MLYKLQPPPRKTKMNYIFVALVGLAFIAILGLPAGWLLMLAFGILHDSYPAVVPFGFIESWVIATAAAFIFKGVSSSN